MRATALQTQGLYVNIFYTKLKSGARRFTLSPKMDKNTAIVTVLATLNLSALGAYAIHEDQSFTLKIRDFIEATISHQNQIPVQPTRKATPEKSQKPLESEDRPDD
ncbi:MAG: hypothetical protein KME13_22505 [Myxacorys californica WJT36-NPBG1]|jgi:hypothetical protein|nr:hypothetical protein [Myxacorys californica WJT36-NPBG1]